MRPRVGPGCCGGVTPCGRLIAPHRLTTTTTRLGRGSRSRSGASRIGRVLVTGATMSWALSRCSPCCAANGTCVTRTPPDTSTAPAWCKPGTVPCAESCPEVASLSFTWVCLTRHRHSARCVTCHRLHRPNGEGSKRPTPWPRLVPSAPPTSIPTCLALAELISTG